MNPATSTVAAEPPAVRANLRTNAQVQVAAIVAAATAVKLAICPMVGLGTNEAYAIASGRLMSLSYFDHPPLHFWLAHLCEKLLGDVSTARIPFILLSAATSWLMFLLTRTLFGERAAVWATLALNLSVFFNLVSGNWILPDGPLNFFLLATAVVLVPAARGQSLTIQRWAMAGVLAGLAALSKYHAFLFLLGFLVFLLIDKSRRKIMLTPGPWVAAVIALAVFSPVLIWNDANGWASLRFQGGRAVPHHLGIGLFFSLLAAQWATLLPGALVPLLAGGRKALGSREPEDQFLLWLGLPIVALFTLIPLLTDNGMMHWAMPGWLLLMPLGGKYLADVSRSARWPLYAAFAAAAMMFAGTIAAAFEFQDGLIGTALPRLFKRGDPTADNASWSAVTPLLLSQSAKQNPIVVTLGWRDAAKIDEALAGSRRVIVAANDPRNFAVGLDPQGYKGEGGWIVLRAPYSERSQEAARHCFLRSNETAHVVVGRNARPDARLTVFLGESFDPARCGLTAYKN